MYEIDPLLLDAISENRHEKDMLRLRKRLNHSFPAEKARFICEQIMLRKKGSEKFSNAQSMLFEREALEQASHQVVAGYHASLFNANDRVLDICTGIGSDAIAFSRRVNYVYTVDCDKERLALAEYNHRICCAPQNINFINQKIEDISLPPDITGIYADPSRRTNKKRTILPSNAQPSLDVVLAIMEKKGIAFGKTLIKLAPAVDYSELLKQGEIQVISYRGQVREVLFIPGGDLRGLIRAVLLDSDSRVMYELNNTQNGLMRLSEMRTILIEPDPAIIRANLISQWASQHDAYAIDPHIAYLTADAYVSDSSAECFRVIHHMPYSVKDIKRYLRLHSIDHISIKKRALQKSAQHIQKELKIKAGSNHHYLFVFRRGRGVYAVHATKDTTVTSR